MGRILLPLRGHLHPYQEVELRKAFFEHFVLAHVATPAHFYVRESNQAFEVVTINLETGAVSCSCITRACVCKHACYVLIWIFGFGRMSPSELAFLETLRLTEAQVSSVRSSFAHGRFDLLIGPGKSKDFTTLVKHPRIGDDCPICLEPFRHVADVRCCPDCGSNVHTVCVRTWMTSAGRGRRACVVCRSGAWERWDGS
jgi:hypothetical protein